MCPAKSLFLIIAVVAIVAIIAPSVVLTGCSNTTNYTPNTSVSPGTFENVEDAVKDFGEKYLNKSIQNDKEYATVIHEEVIDGKTLYTYSVVSEGKQHSVKPYFTRGKTSVATVHTHGAPSMDYNDETFSEQDKLFANQYNLQSYLFTPSKKLILYDPSQSIESVITWNGGT